METAQKPLTDPSHPNHHRLRFQKVYWNWDIVWSCNYRCSYCFFAKRWERSAEKNSFPGLETVLAAWERIYNLYGSCHIHIAGGEPFTYPDFMELLSALAPRHTLEMSSNLSFDADELIRRVPPDRIKLEPSFHLEFADHKEYLAKCVKLRDAGYRVGVTMVGGPRYLRRYARIKEDFLKNGFGINLVPLRGKYYGAEYPDAYTDEEKKVLKIAIEKVKPHQADPTPAATEAIAASAAAVPGTPAPAIAPAEPAPAAPPAPAGKNGSPPPTKNASERYYQWHVDKDYENLTETRLCMMGFNYGKIHPNGDVLRCCTVGVEDLVKVGNIFDPEFRLFEKPAPCSISTCGCWKSMVVGQEAKWKQFWSDK